jgi:DNA-binding beta-propeller fold protein YncE
VRRLLNTRTLTAVVSALALSGTWAGVAEASDQLGYVTNEQAGTVSQVDLATGTVGMPIAVGSQPVDVAITADGSMAYVADYGSSEIVPVALATGTVGSPIALHDRPNAIAIAPDGKTAYVVSDNGRDWPITLAADRVGNPTTIPANSDAIAIAPGGNAAYITNVADGTITPFTLATGVVGQPINLSSSTPDGVAITPDGSTAYVASNSAGTITPLDLATGTNGVPIALGAGTQPTSVAISADGSTAYVTDFGTGDITPVSLPSGTPGTPIPVGGQPSAIALVPASGITAAPPPASGGSSSGSGGSGSASATLGNQQLTLTVSPAPGGSSSAAQACHAPNSKLAITLRRQTLKHAAKLKFRHATFTLGKLAKRAKHLPATARFSLRGLKAGVHRVTVRAYYTELLARAGRSSGHKLTVTISKTLTTRFTVC